MAKHTKTTRETASEFRERVRRTRVLNILVIIVIVALAFVLGFVVRGNSDFMERLGFNNTEKADQNPGMTIHGDTLNSLSARVAEIEGILNNNSFDSYDLETTTQGVLDAISKSTKDKYFRYYSPQRYNAYMKENASTTTNYGIGVLLGDFEGHAYVVDVFEDSPAQKSGVRIGDFVEAINGDRSETWSVDEATNAFTNENQDSVWVTWRRPVTLSVTGGEEFTTQLYCSESTTQNVTATLDRKIGHVEIKQITKNASNLVSESIANLEGQGAESFIIDLRNCPGGYLSQAVEIANLFMKSGTVVQIMTTAGISTKSVTGNTITEKPVVVLVNENTASSAEVLAAALQSTGLIQVIGQNTMGKGSVQSTKALSFGGTVRYTVAYYLSPSGQGIDGVGVTPTMTVEKRGNTDNQYNLALDVAGSLR